MGGKSNCMFREKQANEGGNSKFHCFCRVAGNVVYETNPNSIDCGNEGVKG